MARIAGVDIPNAKRVEIALTYIYGIGRKSANDILAKTGINPDTVDIGKGDFYAFCVRNINTSYTSHSLFTSLFVNVCH